MSFTFQEEYCPTNRIHCTAEPYTRLLQPNWLYLQRVQYDHGPHNIASLFRMLTWYCGKISFFIPSNALLTVSSSLSADGGPNLMHKEFLPLPWKNSMNVIKFPVLWPLKHKVFIVDRIVPLFVRSIICKWKLHCLLSLWTGVSIINHPVIYTQFATLFIDQASQQFSQPTSRPFDGITDLWWSFHWHWLYGQGTPGATSSTSITVKSGRICGTWWTMLLLNSALNYISSCIQAARLIHGWGATFIILKMQYRRTPRLNEPQNCNVKMSSKHFSSLLQEYQWSQ